MITKVVSKEPLATFTKQPSCFNYDTSPAHRSRILTNLFACFVSITKKTCGFSCCFCKVL